MALYATQPDRHAQQLPVTAAMVDATPFVALSAWAPVAVDPPACLRIRSRLSTCRACADACPTGSMQLAEQRLSLGGGCTGCGRCQAACPMGALAVDGFAEPLSAPPANGATLRVVCARADPAPPGSHEFRVPCLGGISAGQLLMWCAADPGRRVLLADPGECERCDSAAGQHPARTTVDAVAGWLREAGVPEALRPEIEGRCGTGVRSPRLRGVDPMQAAGRARRGLAIAAARPRVPPAERPVRLARIAPSRERLRTLAALQRLADLYGGSLPAALTHRPELSAACRGHRSCAAACPTGALRRWRDEASARAGIAFDATACIGCGHCVTACPERALVLRPGQGDLRAGHRPLSAHVQRECADCGARFAVNDNHCETRCERCLKSARLARSAFQALFGARP